MNTSYIGSSISSRMYLAGLAVVELMRHTLLDGSVADHVNVVADLDVLKVGGEVEASLLAELPREEVTSPRAQTERVRHGRLERRMGGATRHSRAGRERTGRAPTAPSPTPYAHRQLRHINISGPSYIPRHSHKRSKMTFTSY